MTGTVRVSTAFNVRVMFFLPARKSRADIPLHLASDRRMAFKFIHSADWQIGKTFGRFPVEVQSQLREARLGAIDRMAALTERFGAAHVLVGGDVFDSEGLSDLTVRQPLEVMSGHGRVTWHLLPGNHDPLRAGGIWDRVSAIGRPDNVQVYETGSPVEIEDGVMLLPAPLRGRVAHDDPTAWMDDAELPAGALKIGLAHGSIGRYGTDDHASVPLDPNRATSAGLDYMALGDDHGMKKINARTWYSGTPEPDGWRQNDPGHVLCVEVVGGGADPVVTPERTGLFAWGEFEAGVDADGSIVGIVDQIDALSATMRNCLVRLSLRGSLSLSAGQNLDRHVDRLAAQVRHLDADRSGVRRLAGPDDISVLGEGTELHKVGMRLMRKIDRANVSAEDADIALMALNELIARNEELGG